MRTTSMCCASSASNCKVLVAIGACAINGGIPAMRNHFDLRECLEEAYIDGVGVANPMIPDDPEFRCC